MKRKFEQKTDEARTDFQSKNANRMMDGRTDFQSTETDTLRFR